MSGFFVDSKVEITGNVIERVCCQFNDHQQTPGNVLR